MTQELPEKNGYRIVTDGLAYRVQRASPLGLNQWSWVFVTDDHKLGAPACEYRWLWLAKLRMRRELRTHACAVKAWLPVS